ncbi:MAG: DUF2153 domain-containing protein [Thermofilaceae archaeon]|nr:DUF2153 domain-containing protein [Thermofilaceae archaeon]MCX8181102.1 DUF2153 domain-containing protein [Thermofilaceae archaeon]MDW8004583.1 DUF2153 family protein [Thermofilaceae archaeon]
MGESHSARSFVTNLEQWVETQKLVLSSMFRIEDRLKESDRLELILATRMAFRHMIRTLEAFDRWLQDPLIVGHMPREMLEQVQRKSWELMKQLLELDIDHTSQFKEYFNKLAKEGKLNPLLTAQGGEERRVPGVF